MVGLFVITSETSKALLASFDVSWAILEKLPTGGIGIDDIYTFLKTPQELLDFSLYPCSFSNTPKKSPLSPV